MKAFHIFQLVICFSALSFPAYSGSIKIKLCNRLQSSPTKFLVDSKCGIEGKVEVCSYRALCAQENEESGKKWVGVRHVYCKADKDGKCPETNVCASRNDFGGLEFATMNATSDRYSGRERMKTIFQKAIDAHSYEEKVYGPLNPKE